MEITPYFFRFRVLAYFADFFLVLMFTSVGLIGATMSMFFIPELETHDILPLITGILFILISFGYFTFAEAFASTTLGKFLYDLETIDESGSKITFKQALIRNLPKVRPEFVIIDLIVGYIIRPSTNQRLFDILSKTNSTKSAVDRKYTQREQSTIEVIRVVLSLLGIIFFLLMLLSYIFAILTFLTTL
ncbi:MAG: RDD family protein [Candidatus Heimdallarchaeota archaeon]|nr:MAG: RDD family protein [Candidatus Heimdallarchaeota archaeon]